MTDVVECRTARPSFLLRCLIILAVAVGALLTSAASASASPIAQPTAASVSAAFAASSTPNALLADQKPMGSDTADSCAATTADTKWLPVGRWSTPASNLHSRLDADFWNDISQKIQRSGIFYLMLSSGNGLWSISADMATFAQRFCVMDKVGATIDSAAGTLWTGLTNSGTVALIVGLGVAVALATQVRRGDAQGTWKRLFRTAMILALMGVMSYGASTTTGGGTSGAPVSFGAGSPGWFASKINKVVTAVASAPAAAVASQGPDAAYGKPDPKDPLSCAWYRQNLLKNYEASIKTGSGSLSTKAVAAVPENLSSMWETSGLAAWTGIQFGTANDYGKRIYCHVLDMSGVHPGGGEAIALTGPGKAALPPNANP
ncbi:MAG: hypothetical protein M3Y35_05175, partial [Actinomycetota bacterium]|nr:hypothetical protein [Actinomycetota bacterium]